MAHVAVHMAIRLFGSPSGVPHLVLTAFQRFPAGETSGDAKVIDQVRHMFFRI